MEKIELMDILTLSEGEKLTIKMIKSIDEIDCIDLQEQKIWFKNFSELTWEGNSMGGHTFTFDSDHGWAMTWETKRGIIQSVDTYNI